MNADQAMVDELREYCEDFCREFPGLPTDLWD